MDRRASRSAVLGKGPHQTDSPCLDLPVLVLVLVQGRVMATIAMAMKKLAQQQAERQTNHRRHLLRLLRLQTRRPLQLVQLAWVQVAVVV